MLIVLLDHAGRGAGVWCVCARVPVHTKRKEGFYPKIIRKKQRTRRTKKNGKMPKKKVPVGGNFLGGITGGGTFGEVMPYGGNFLAVGGFSFFGGNDFVGEGKTKVWW